MHFLRTPFKKGYDYLEQRTYKIFCQKELDSVRQIYKLTQSLRTQDRWLSAMLEAYRYGRESWEMYCFVHGLPTRNTGTWLPDENAPTCGEDYCRRFSQEIWQRDWNNGVDWKTHHETY